MMGRRSVVTGGTKGIGLAVTQRLVADGHEVVAVSREPSDISSLGERARWVVGDVTSVESMRAVRGLIGPVEILVLCAGRVVTNRIDRVSVPEWEDQFRVNALGALLASQVFVPDMQRAGWGRVVAVASTASHVGAPYTASYTASKHALLGFIRTLAAELRGTGTTANCVCPTYVTSPMTERAIESIAERTGMDVDQARSRLAHSGPLGRLLDPAEVAHAVAFFADERSAAITGQSIILDGGGIQQ